MQRRKPPPEIIELDLHEHDTVDALQYLLQLCNENKVSGMVFAATLKGSSPVFGTTGRLASNGIEAAGLAAILEAQLTQPYLSCAAHRQ